MPKKFYSLIFIFFSCNSINSKKLNSDSIFFSNLCTRNEIPTIKINSRNNDSIKLAFTGDT